ncbi:MAG: LysM peptidoglycan-binding domain-containing protein [Myxococcota bacterium]
MPLNGVDDPSHIEVGQKLKIFPAAGAREVWVEVEVQRGDSLSRLAQKHGARLRPAGLERPRRPLGDPPRQRLKVRGG